MPRIFRALSSAFLAALILSPTALSFSTTLSDEAVRDAYFLGQHHDASVASYLDRYVKHLPAPKTGPYISSVALFTPFAQLVELSDKQIGSYSAQQAEQDHRGRPEVVRIDIEVDLTPTYGPLLSASEVKDHPQSPLISRFPDFWHDFKFEVKDGDRLLEGSTLQGSPKYRCGEYGSCSLTGASVQLELSADSFTSDTVTVSITPPVGTILSAKFDLNALR